MDAERGSTGPPQHASPRRFSGGPGPDLPARRSVRDLSRWIAFGIHGRRATRRRQWQLAPVDPPLDRLLADLRSRQRERPFACVVRPVGFPCLRRRSATFGCFRPAQEGVATIRRGDLLHYGLSSSRPGRPLQAPTACSDEPSTARSTPCCLASIPRRPVPLLDRSEPYHNRHLDRREAEPEEHC